jgi:hypothetical protein
MLDAMASPDDHGKCKVIHWDLITMDTHSIESCIGLYRSAGKEATRAEL